MDSGSIYTKNTAAESFLPSTPPDSSSLPWPDALLPPLTLLTAVPNFMFLPGNFMYPAFVGHKEAMDAPAVTRSLPSAELLPPLASSNSGSNFIFTGLPDPMHLGSVVPKETTSAPAATRSLPAAEPLRPSLIPPNSTPVITPPFALPRFALPEAKSSAGTGANSTSSSTANSNHAYKNEYSMAKFHPFTGIPIHHGIGFIKKMGFLRSLPVNPDTGQLKVSINPGTGKLEVENQAITYGAYRQQVSEWIRKNKQPHAHTAHMTLEEFMSHKHLKEIQIWLIEKYFSKGLPNRKEYQMLLKPMKEDEVHQDVIECLENQMNKNIIKKTKCDAYVHPITGDLYSKTNGAINKRAFNKLLPTNFSGEIDPNCNSYTANAKQYNKNEVSNIQPNIKPKMANITKFINLKENVRIEVMKKLVTHFFQTPTFKASTQLFDNLLKGMAGKKFEKVRKFLEEEALKLCPDYKPRFNSSSPSENSAGAGAGAPVISASASRAGFFNPAPAPIMSETKNAASANDGNDAKQTTINTPKEPIDADETISTGQFFKRKREPVSTTSEENAQRTKRLKTDKDDSLLTLESVRLNIGANLG